MISWHISAHRASGGYPVPTGQEAGGSEVERMRRPSCVQELVELAGFIGGRWGGAARAHGARAEHGRPHHGGRELRLVVGV